MAQSSPTLKSKLRVLVAKTYRAERMYSSMRNSSGASLPAINSIVNEVRAREWQLANEQLRRTVSELIKLSNTTLIANELEALLESYNSRIESSRLAMSDGSQELNSSLERDEFVDLFKGSLELVRLKARVQSLSVVLDEITVLLESCGRSTKRKARFLNKQASLSETATSDGSQNNVIDFQRLLASQKQSRL